MFLSREKKALNVSVVLRIKTARAIAAVAVAMAIPISDNKWILC